MNPQEQSVEKRNGMAAGEVMERPSAVANAMAAAAMAEVRLAMQLAVEHPRNEDAAFSTIVKRCRRFSFAEKAVYAYPRGTTIVSGPSIKLAEEMGKSWGNLRFGAQVVMDEGEKRTVRAWAWDLQTNTRKELDITFDKLIYRKKEGWIVPDERDLLELTNRNASKGVRNCILGLLPYDLVEDAVKECKKTIKDGIKKDPEAMRKSIIASFTELGVNGAELSAYVGFPLDQLRDEDKLAELRSLYRSIKDGEVSWQEVVGRKAQEMGLEGAPPTTASELRNRVREKANQSAPTDDPKTSGGGETGKKR